MNKCPPQIANNPIYYPPWERCWNFDKDFLIAFVGDRGSGKTSAGITFLWNVCRTSEGKPLFSNEFIVYDAIHFVDLVRSDTMSKGMGILWDEPQTEKSMKNRNAMTYQNRVITDVIDTCRERNLIVAYALPAASQIDKVARTHFHACVKMEEPGRGKFLWWESDSITGKIFKKTPTIIDDSGVRRKRGILNFNRPPAHIWDKYKVDKRAFTDSLYGEFSGRLTRTKDGVEENSSNKNFNDARTLMENDWKKYWFSESKKVDKMQLEIDFPAFQSRQILALKDVIENFGRKEVRELKEVAKIKKFEEKGKREYADASKYING